MSAEPRSTASQWSRLGGRAALKPSHLPHHRHRDVDVVAGFHGAELRDPIAQALIERYGVDAGADDEALAAGIAGALLRVFHHMAPESPPRHDGMHGKLADAADLRIVGHGDPAAHGDKTELIVEAEHDVIADKVFGVVLLGPVLAQRSLLRGAVSIAGQFFEAAVAQI